MAFLRKTWDILWFCIRYLAACVLGTLGIMSLASGKFPPPVKEIYQNISNIQQAVNLSETTAKIAKARGEQRQIMDFLDNVDDEGAKRPSVKPAAAVAGAESRTVVDENGQQVASDKERIKALEYEVAYLKAKLARAEWEIRQAQSRQATATQQTQ